MTEIPSSGRLLELIEDRLEAATGEPRHVTDVEIEFSVEPDEARNWSAHARCRSEYQKTLASIVDQLQAEYPVIEFG